jgi:hypothetical protein
VAPRFAMSACRRLVGALSFALASGAGFAHEPPSGEFQGPGWICPEEGPFSECDDGPFGVPSIRGTRDDIGRWEFSRDWPVQATHVVVLSTGKVLIWRGTYVPTTLYVYDPKTDRFVNQVDASGGLDLFCAGHCVLSDGRVAIVGGEQDEGPPAVGIRDMNLYNPFTNRSVNVKSMTFGRWYPSAVTLADGRVLALSGQKPADANGPRGSVTIPEVYDPERNEWRLLWNPETERWTVVASSLRSRMYHSTSVLLPDGRVLTAGGENCGSNGRTNVEETNGEIYSPPYLFRGPRPVIDATPTELSYGMSFRVDTPNADSIDSVALLRPGAVTHSVDQGQRYVPLTFKRRSGRLDVDAPAGGGTAPPGYYMLFIVDDAGVPSVAKFVRIDRCDGNCSADRDDDGIDDTRDNCPTTVNAGQADADGDGMGNACDNDDGDGIPDQEDNCRLVTNADQSDQNSDELGDACDLDQDNDGLEDSVDNCPCHANEDQKDLDRDDAGDACDPDDDEDGVEDEVDNCQRFSNSGQEDTDGDGLGDTCDSDVDGDEVEDADDNCPSAPNEDQADWDQDGVGDACDSPPPGPLFVRSDANHDTKVNLADAQFILNYLFLGGPVAPCEEAANISDTFELDITAPIHLLRALFLGDVRVPQPYPNCGLDPTTDGFECEEYDHCQ